MFELLSVADTVVETAWYRHPLVVLVLLAAVISLSVLLGNFIAKSLRSQDHSWRLSLIIGVIAVSILSILLTWPPKFGVDLRGGITIIGQLRQDAELSETIDIKTMIPQLVARVDPTGTREILIRALGTDKVEVVIPDVDMEEAMGIWERLTQAGELKFRIVADHNYHPSLTARAGELIEKKINDSIVREKLADPADNKSGKIIARWYELGRVSATELAGDLVKTFDVTAQDIRDGIVPFKFMPQTSHLVRNGKTKQLINMQQFGGSTSALSRWVHDQKISKVEILCVEPEGPEDIMDVQGEHLKRADSGVDDRARPAVHFEMNRDGARRMNALTGRNKADGNRLKLLAIISDGKLITAPTINSTIRDRGIIEGSFSQREVDNLVANLRAGKLEVALSENPISLDYQQSTTGEDLKRKGVISCIVSLLAVTLFMTIYYRFAGIVASVVLGLNLFFLLAVVMIIKQPLTLTGLAGIALTTGMSVDANVLICERIRDELKKGAALRMAIRNGYDRAMSTIIDTNMTTFLTGAVLYVLGTEQLKGFAVTLCLGIVISMFTAVFCSRVVMELAERRKWITQLKMLSIFPGGIYDFLSKRRICYAISLAAIAIGLVAMYFRGSEIFDQDLRGGSTARIVLNEGANLSVEQVREMLDQYEGKISDRETAQFSVARIDSTEYPNRVFKVDSNIPIWDKPEPAPYEPIDQALIKTLGPQLMRRRVDYDPAQLVVTKVATDAEPNGNAPSNGETPPPSENPPANPPSGPSGGVGYLRFPYKTVAPALVAGTRPAATRLVLGALSTALHGVLVIDAQEPATQKQDTPPAEPNSESKPAEEPAKQDPASQEPAPTTPATQEPEKSPEQQAAARAVSGAERFSAKVDLKFAQPIARGSLINSMVLAADSTNQISLDPTDVEATAAGKNPDELSVQSDAWTVTMNLAREVDAKLILDALQESYNDKPFFPTVSGVGGQIATETQWRALAAIFASLVGIVVYVWIRFQSVAFGLGAVVGLIHNVLITLGAVALSYWLAPYLGFLQVENFRISLAMIAAFLTLIGYSINDTIVVFDRIREVRGKRHELTAEMINISVSQTLSRTIITSTLYLLAVIVLYFFGGESIHGFSFALAIGIIVGPYTSIFISSPIALWLINRSLSAQAAKKVVPTAIPSKVGSR